MNIDAAIRDPKLFGAALGVDLKTWQTWRAVLKATFGLDLTDDEAAVFASVAGGRKPPQKRVRELWSILGRRSGKSRIAALIAAYIASFVDHRQKLAPGEIGTVLILAASKSQANTVFSYVRAFFESSPIIRQQVEEITADEIRLHGNIVLSVHTNNYRTVRGRTLLACIFDEVGFWRDETTSLPDVETYRAVLPALATTNGILVAISSPYAQRGLLYTKHQSCFGHDDPDVLVVQAGTLTFNPTIDPGIISAASEDDPEAARAEWHAEFRGDISTFVDRTVVEKCIEAAVRQRPFQFRYKYVAHCDPSGGQHDSMTLAIAHREGERAVLDLTAEWKAPFNPDDVMDDIAKLLKSYRVTSVTGDAYASAWVQHGFRRQGLTYKHSEHNRSELYLQLLPLLTAGNAVLLDQPRLIGQISQLERRTGRGGRDSIDHMRGAHDDLAVAAAGALVRAMARPDRRDERRSFPKVNVGYQHFKERHRFGRWR
jgi:Terminase large subunit, ATPase domain